MRQRHSCLSRLSSVTIVHTLGDGALNVDDNDGKYSENLAERDMPQAKRCGRFPPDASRGQPFKPAQPRPKIRNAATARGGEMVIMMMIMVR
jgi:hypothetical protein